MRGKQTTDSCTWNTSRQQHHGRPSVTLGEAREKDPPVNVLHSANPSAETTWSRGARAGGGLAAEGRSPSRSEGGRGLLSHARGEAHQPNTSATHTSGYTKSSTAKLQRRGPWATNFDIMPFPAVPLTRLPPDQGNLSKGLRATVWTWARPAQDTEGGTQGRWGQSAYGHTRGACWKETPWHHLRVSNKAVSDVFSFLNSGVFCSNEVLHRIPAPSPPRPVSARGPVCGSVFT